MYVRERTGWEKVKGKGMVRKSRRDVSFYICVGVELFGL